MEITFSFLCLVENSIVLSVTQQRNNVPFQDKSGIGPGDLIFSIDGVATEKLPLPEAALKLNGPMGTTVTLGVSKYETDQSTLLTIHRQPVANQRIFPCVLRKKYLYIHASKLTAGSATGFFHAVDQLYSTLPEKGGLIIDLRCSNGGFLAEAIRIADFFIGKGMITAVQTRTGKHRKWANRNTICDTSPIMVLINGNTSAGSEVIAGSLGENNRALILGTKSIGMGNFQTVRPLNDSLSLRVTSGRFLTPLGNDIEKNGIRPHIELPSTLQHDNEFPAFLWHSRTDRLIEMALDVLEKTPSNTLTDLLETAKMLIQSFSISTSIPV